MKRIFKYELSITDVQTLDLPHAARILSVMEQQNNIVLYALIDDEETVIHGHTIKIVGTGHPFPDCDAWDYLGTVQQYGGVFVWHIFENPRRLVIKC
jgi:hypothetical protein